MKICVAQTRSIKDDIEKNIDNHKRLIDLAISYKANAIFFPELSITGYEPERSKELATTPNDSRFDDFQRISNTRQIIMGIGAPTQQEAGTCISMILFQPHTTRLLYTKKHLHKDEEPYFVSGGSCPGLVHDKTNISIAICYELSIPEHAENAFKSGAQVYVASVAKSADGVEKAVKRLSEIGSKYSMTVLMANCVGYCDNFESAGGTAVWNNKGSLAAQLDDSSQGIIIYDTETQQVVQEKI